MNATQNSNEHGSAVVSETRRNVILAVLLAAICLSLLALFWISGKSPPDNPVTISFSGLQAGEAFRAAGFVVSNQLNCSIVLTRVEVEATNKHGWIMLAAGQPQISHSLEPGSPQLNLQPLLEAREHRTVVVEWPGERPWRVKNRLLQRAAWLEKSIHQDQMGIPNSGLATS